MNYDEININGYTPIHYFDFGDRMLLVLENKNEQLRYACGFYECSDFGYERIADCVLSDNYITIMQGFSKRTVEQVEDWCKVNPKKLRVYEKDKYSPIQSNDDLTGKVVVLEADFLRRECQCAEHQLFFVTGGNGAKPNAIGTKVYGYDLYSKDSSYVRRASISGIADNNKLPEWATINLDAIKSDIVKEDRSER